MRTAAVRAAAMAAVVTLGAASGAVAQTQVAGFNVEGDVEAGVRAFIERPSKTTRGKFEEYRDIPSGGFLEGLNLRLSRPDESYGFELGGTKWGQADQEFSLGAGRPGLWQFGFEWNQIPHLYFSNARVLWDEVSRGVYTLPSPRPALGAYNAGHDRDIGVRWDNAHILLTLTPSPDLDIQAEYTRTRKEGDKPFGMAFGSPGSNFLEMLEPIEHTIHDFRLRATIAREHWQLQAGYAGSIFQNDLNRVSADNPCFGLAACGAGDAAGPSRGQTSLPPDNMAHTFTLAGGVNLPMRTRLTGNLAYSLRIQNDSFLPHTINPTVAVSPDLVLPRKSLNGNVQIFSVYLNGVTRPLPPLTLTAKYRLYDLHDLSDEITFPGHVVNDRPPVVGEERRAGRWSWARQNGDLDARWQIVQPVALTLGVGWERWDRNDHREVRDQDEFFGKVKVDATPFDWLLARLTYTPSYRRIAAYHPRAHAEHTVEEDAASALQGQSTLLRKFDEADRNRQKIEFQLQIMPTDFFSVTPTVAYRYDDYRASALGLQRETNWSAGIDFGWTPLERISISGGYVHELNDQRMRSRSRPVTGANTFDFIDFDWVSNLADTVDTFHLSTKMTLIPGVLDWTANGNYTTAVGRFDTNNPIAPQSGTAAQNATARAKPFPAFEDTFIRIDTALRYHFAKAWTASFGYVFESFQKNDFRTDRLNPFIPGVTSIWLGDDVKNYTAHIVGATLAYRFK